MRRPRPAVTPLVPAALVAFVAALAAAIGLVACDGIFATAGKTVPAPGGMPPFAPPPPAGLPSAAGASAPAQAPGALPTVVSASSAAAGPSHTAMPRPAVATLPRRPAVTPPPVSAAPPRGSVLGEASGSGNLPGRHLRELACPSAGLAPFPWPDVPQPSSWLLIPNDKVFGARAEGRTLRDAAERLDAAANAAGYPERRYLAAGCHGFALVLGFEHIRGDGRREPGDGFALPGQVAGFSLGAYLQRLFSAPPGYYRQIVLVVADGNPEGATPAPTAAQLRAIAGRGSARLPPALEATPYGWQSRVTALVYEFRKGPNEGDAAFIPAAGRLSPDKHLQMARLF